MVVAVGASPTIPAIRGIGSANVTTAADLARNGEVTGDAVVVIGGGLIGCDVALYLAQQRKKVTIVECGPFAEDMNPISRMALIPMLHELGVVIAPVTLREFTVGGLIATGLDGKEQTVRADSVVIATETAPTDALASRLESELYELLVVGDCAGARGMTRAIHEGFVAGWRV